MPWSTAPVPPARVAAPLLPRRGSTRAVAEPAPRRLAGLDGIRGLAAAYVVINHIFLRAFPGYPVDNAPWWAGWFMYGRFAVVVFIVLSGFSLGVSPARHGWRLGGLATYARRRAWRILPPYWAALVFSLADDLAACVAQPGWPEPNGKSVVVNGLLIQDVFGVPSPNRAFWSIAIEAQLYVAASAAAARDASGERAGDGRHRHVCWSPRWAPWVSARRRSGHSSPSTRLISPHFSRWAFSPPGW